MTFYYFLNTTCKLVSSVWVLGVSFRLGCHLDLCVTLVLCRQCMLWEYFLKNSMYHCSWRRTLETWILFAAWGYFSSKETFVRNCGFVYLHLLSEIQLLKKHCAVLRGQSYGKVQECFYVPWHNINFFFFPFKWSVRINICT